MNCVSRFSADLGKSKSIGFLFYVSCGLACCAKHSQNTSNHTIVPKLSPHTPKKILEKIYKAFIRCMCMKAKEQEEFSPNNSKKFMEKISKAFPFVCVVIKHKQEDDKCLWKKTILMGEKCQPLQFSGAIFYDSEGNQISEIPRSPRTTTLLFPALAKRGEFMEM